jgi:hypothetical protein
VWTTPEFGLPKQTANAPSKVDSYRVVIAENASIGLQKFGRFIVEICGLKSNLIKSAVEDPVHGFAIVDQ